MLKMLVVLGGFSSIIISAHDRDECLKDVHYGHGDTLKDKMLDSQ